jgi:hypothetical protein
MSLDPVAKEVWCEALRSGEFRQCKGAMHDGAGGHCCLGVAMEIFPWLTDYDGRGQILSEESCELLGLGFNGWDAAVQQQLSEMNDADSSFADIADYIERNL